VGVRRDGHRRRSGAQKVAARRVFYAGAQSIRDALVAELEPGTR
jgi:hypothetical protein